MTTTVQSTSRRPATISTRDPAATCGLNDTALPAVGPGFTVFGVTVADLMGWEAKRA